MRFIDFEQNKIIIHERFILAAEKCLRLIIWKHEQTDRDRERVDDFVKRFKLSRNVISVGVLNAILFDLNWYNQRFGTEFELDAPIIFRKRVFVESTTLLRKHSGECFLLFFSGIIVKCRLPTTTFCYIRCRSLVDVERPRRIHYSQVINY